MSTTTVRLPPELKRRIARAAQHAGTTTHSLILEAIAEKAEREELRRGFHEEAEQRYAKIVASGKAISWTEMRRYLTRRVARPKVARPRSRTLVP